MSLPFVILGLAAAIGLAYHAVRTRQDSFWLWIILIFQPVGGLAYFVIVVVPSLLGGTRAQKARADAVRVLDPGREHREARAALELTPTVGNRMRLAAAAARLGRWDEAEAQYREAAHGVHADDPALRLGRARALIELDRAPEALPLLEALRADPDEPASPDAVLAHARALEAVGRPVEAEAAYREAYDRLPGFEAIARYAAFLGRQGRRDQGRLLLADIDQRLGRLHGPFAKEARAWRDLAAAGLR